MHKVSKSLLTQQLAVARELRERLAADCATSSSSSSSAVARGDAAAFFSLPCWTTRGSPETRLGQPLGWGSRAARLGQPLQHLGGVHESWLNTNITPLTKGPRVL